MAALLRPMNLGEILDRAFEIYRKRLWLFVGVGVLPATAMLALRSVDIAWVQTNNLVNGFSDGEVTRGGYIAWSWLVAYGYSHISGFLMLLIFPALLQLASCEVFGDSTTIISSLRFALARWRSFLWLAVLVLATVLIFPEILTFGLLFAAVTVADKLDLLGNPPNVPAVIAVLLTIPAGLVLILWAKACLSFSVPTAAFENLTGFRALRRSWSLTRGSRRRIIVAWLAIMVCYWVLALAARYALKWIVYFLYYAAHFHWLRQHLVSQVALILYGTIEAFVAPIYAIAITLLYYDQRVRKEGFDLEKMMEAAGLVAAPKADGAGALAAESDKA
jgi:hypothetical protein